MTKTSVDYKLRKAKFFLNKDEIGEAQKLYQDILITFPKNVRAQEGLTLVKKHKYFNKTNKSLQENINQLINHYEQEEYSIVVEKAQAILDKYPEQFSMEHSRCMFT